MQTINQGHLDPKILSPLWPASLKVTGKATWICQVVLELLSNGPAIDLPSRGRPRRPTSPPFPIVARFPTAREHAPPAANTGHFRANRASPSDPKSKNRHSDGVSGCRFN